MIGVLVALQDEARRLRSGVTPEPAGSHQGFSCWSGPDATMMLSGAGPSRAAEAARALLQVFRPEVMVVTGLCGGLKPELAEGDVLVAEAVLEAGGYRLEAPADLVERTLQWCPEARRALIASSTEVLVTPKEKGALAESTGAAAVDMESAAAVSVAARLGVPWLVLRAVSDPVDRPLPLDFNRYLNRHGQPSIPAVALAAARRPRTVPGLLALGRCARRAGDALRASLEQVVEGLSRE